MAFTPISGSVAPTSGFTPISALPTAPVAPVSQPTLSPFQSALGAVGNYLNTSVNQIKNTFTNPQAQSLNPTAIVGSAVKNTATAAQQGFQQGVDAVSGMLQDYQNGSGSTAGDVANLAKLTSGVASILFSPITGAFNTAETVPGLKQVADAINVPFTALGFAGSFATGKVVDILPVSQQSKDILKAPLEQLGSLAAQVLVGGKIMGMASDLLKSKGDITPADAQSIVEQARAEVPPVKPGLEPPTPSFKPIESGAPVPVALKETAPTAELAPKVGEVAPVAPDLSPLAQEAQNYSSAEEFAQSALDSGKILVRGDSGAPLAGETPLTDVYFTKDLNIAKQYGDPQIVSTEGLKIATPEDLTRLGIKEYPPAGIDPTAYHQQFLAKMKSAGFDGMDNSVKNATAGVDEPSEVQIFSWAKDKVKTTSLTDFYNKVKGETPSEAPVAKPTSGETPTTGNKVSGVANAIEAKAIQEKLTTSFGNKAGFNSSDFPTQAQMVADLINSGIDNARAVVRGEDAMPKGMKSGALIAGMETYAKENPNLKSEIYRELANSHLASTISEGASETSFARMIDENSPSSALKRANEAVSGGTKGKATFEATVKEAKATISKTASKLIDYNKILDAITC